jgi:hypothetical protein
LAEEANNKLYKNSQGRNTMLPLYGTVQYETKWRLPRAEYPRLCHQLRHPLPAHSTADPSLLQHGASQRPGVGSPPTQVSPLAPLSRAMNQSFGSALVSVRIQDFILITKNCKKLPKGLKTNIFLIKNCNLLIPSQGHYEGRSSYRRSLQLSKHP